MLIWFSILTMAIVGGWWVKMRRARKARTTYVPSN